MHVTNITYVAIVSNVAFEHTIRLLTYQGNIKNHQLKKQTKFTWSLLPPFKN